MRRIDPEFVGAVFEVLRAAGYLMGVEALLEDTARRSPKVKEALLQHRGEILDAGTAAVSWSDRVGLSFFAEQCAAQGLVATAAKARKMLHDGRGRRRINVTRDLPELAERLAAEIDKVGLFITDGRNVGYYDSQAEHFGARALRRFPKATYDMEEAGNCRALERPTACVFHLMRVMERTLRALGKVLGVKDPAETAHRSWGKSLDDIQGAIDARLEANPEWKRHAQYKFFTQSHGLLDTVRVRWRNECMHVDRIYGDREAARIYDAVCEFVDHLAQMPRSI